MAKSKAIVAIEAKATPKPNERNEQQSQEPTKKKREQQYNNWVFTFNNYTDKDEEILQNLDIFEFIIYGHEIAPTTQTKHLQGYFQLTTKKRHTQLKKILPKGIWYEKARGDYSSNQNYCSKEATNIYTRGTPTVKGSNTAQLYDQIIECATWVDVLKLSGIERHMRYASEVFLSKPVERQEGVILRRWQQKLLDTITQNEPDDRHIYVCYDPKGAKGKTFFCKYLFTNYNAFYTSPAKGADILYAYREQKLIVYDIPRSIDEEYVNWGTIEKLKDGIYFNGKFTSMSRYRKGNAHIIIFTNNPIPIGKFSEDRLIYINLEETPELTNILNDLQTQKRPRGRPPKSHLEMEGELVRSTLDVIQKNKEASNENTSEYESDHDSDHEISDDEQFVIDFNK